MTRWKIIRYEDSYRKEWNQFIEKSRNATFLFNREYMDYHSDRFEDYSLMFYAANRLRMVLPANIRNNTLYSHQGLTYGGFLIDNTVTSSDMLQAFEILVEFIKTDPSCHKLIYSPIPYIYSAYPSEEDLYALFRMNAKLVSRKISSVIPLNNSLPFSTLRKRKLKLAMNNGLMKVRENNEFENYWRILEDNLRTKYNAEPVHSLEEIKKLHEAFPKNIRLYEVYEEDNENILGGCVLYISPFVAHVQYISSTFEGRKKGALDYLFYTLLQTMKSKVSYFDMGTSVENGGKYLNEGLIFQKEGFGGRAVMYDSYELMIKENE